MTPVIDYRDEGFIEAYGEAWGSPGLIASYFAEAGCYADIGGGTIWRGHQEIQKFASGMLAFAADSKVEFTDFQCGDHLFVAEWDWSGTATGQLHWHGRIYPPSGRTFKVSGVTVCLMDEIGKIMSHKDFWDTWPFVTQLRLNDGDANVIHSEGR